MRCDDKELNTLESECLCTLSATGTAMEKGLMRRKVENGRQLWKEEEN